MPRKFLALQALTLVLAAALILTQQVWASPLLARLKAPSTVSSKTTINYQGYLTDSAGSPVNDTLDFVLSLYSTGDAVVPEWTESQTGVQVNDGLFSVLLGSVTPLPQTLFAENADLWLGIAVGADVEMTPREKLGSAPFAFSAEVPDGSIGTAKLADDSVSNSKLVANSITSDKIADGQVITVDLANKAVTRGKTTILTFRSGWVSMAMNTNYTFAMNHNLGHMNYTAVCTAEDADNRARHLKPSGFQGNDTAYIRFVVYQGGDDGTQSVRVHCIVIPD